MIYEHGLISLCNWLWVITRSQAKFLVSGNSARAETMLIQKYKILRRYCSNFLPSMSIYCHPEAIHLVRVILAMEIQHSTSVAEAIHLTNDKTAF